MILEDIIQIITLVQQEENNGRKQQITLTIMELSPVTIMITEQP